MTTKSELIAQCKKENPTLKAIVNDEEITLTNDEYEKACADWAEMRFEQIEKEEAAAKAAADKATLLAKLGITADEAKLLLS
jgi:hypothetical protein